MFSQSGVSACLWLFMLEKASFIGILLTPGASVYRIFRFTTTQEKLLNFRLLSNSHTENRGKP